MCERLSGNHRLVDTCMVRFWRGDRGDTCSPAPTLWLLSAPGSCAPCSRGSCSRGSPPCHPPLSPGVCISFSLKCIVLICLSSYCQPIGGCMYRYDPVYTYSVILTSVCCGLFIEELTRRLPYDVDNFCSAARLVIRIYRCSLQMTSRLVYRRGSSPWERSRWV
jgi:hypothetical protein